MNNPLDHFIKKDKTKMKKDKDKIQKILDQDIFSNNNLGDTLKSVFAPTPQVAQQRREAVGTFITNLAKPVAPTTRNDMVGATPRAAFSGITGNVALAVPSTAMIHAVNVAHPTLRNINPNPTIAKPTPTPIKVKSDTTFGQRFGNIVTFGTLQPGGAFNPTSAQIRERRDNLSNVGQTYKALVTNKPIQDSAGRVYTNPAIGVLGIAGGATLAASALPIIGAGAGTIGSTAPIGLLGGAKLAGALGITTVAGTMNGAATNYGLEKRDALGLTRREAMLPEAGRQAAMQQNYLREIGRAGKLEGQKPIPKTFYNLGSRDNPIDGTGGIPTGTAISKYNSQSGQMGFLLGKPQNYTTATPDKLTNNLMNEIIRAPLTMSEKGFVGKAGVMEGQPKGKPLLRTAYDWEKGILVNPSGQGFSIRSEPVYVQEGGKPTNIKAWESPAGLADASKPMFAPVQSTPMNRARYYTGLENAGLLNSSEAKLASITQDSGLWKKDNVWRS